MRRGQKRVRSPLIFQIDAAGVGTLFIWTGCRGFTGPVPLPLWIRAILIMEGQAHLGVRHQTTCELPLLFYWKSPGAFPDFLYLGVSSYFFFRGAFHFVSCWDLLSGMQQSVLKLLVLCTSCTLPSWGCFQFAGSLLFTLLVEEFTTFKTQSQAL